MKLIVLGSSSSGNGYILTDNKESLIIECGIRLSSVKKALDFDITGIVGAIVTHEHGDHMGRVEEYLGAGIPVFCSKGSVDGFKFKKERRPQIISHGKQFNVGSFKIMPFNVQHDVHEPLGYLIRHPTAGKILFLTDTYFSKYTFNGLSHILVEANYNEEIVKKNLISGKIHPAQARRLFTSHMSINTCKQLLAANNLTSVQNIVLLHLSSMNSDADQFKTEIARATGKMVYIAEKGLIINMNKDGW